MVSLPRSVGGFHDILINSRVFSLALRWVTLEKVFGVGAVRRWLYLAPKALGVGPAKHCLVLSLQWVVMPFPGDVKPPGLDICDGVDGPGTYSSGTGSPQVRLPGAQACLELGYEVGS
jgi:hypothetical protein